MENPFTLNPATVNLAEMLRVAIAHHQAGRLPQAEQLYRQILQQHPQNADALSLLGVIACQQQQLERGIALYQQALAIRPDHRQARENLSLALWKQGKRLMDEAIANLNRLSHFGVDPASNHVMLGMLYQEQEWFEQALIHYQQALATDPSNPDTLNRVGTVLQAQNKPNFAVHFFRRAIALQPTHVDALINLAKALLDQGDVKGGLTFINQALTINPQHPVARYNRALMLLVQGKFAEGFPEYEWRFKTPDFPPCPFLQPKWDGSNLEGKTLLLHAEQGLGDTIQFIRYAAIAAQKGGRVILTCSQPLIRLLSTISGIAQITPMGAPLPEFQVYVPLLSLPGVLGTTMDTVPVAVPYLTVPTTAFRLPPPPIVQPRLKVGLAWSGGNLYKQNQQRSFSLKEFEPVLNCDRIAFYSLQKGIPQLEITEQGWADRLVDLSDQLHDLADTAAAIAQLDLVITVDTVVAHLAGALGKPVWVLLAHVPDWRWMQGRTDSPWYPTMRLFRQPQPGDWQRVMQDVITSLMSD
ncbi:MAG: tetratricopeptide repeat-containing glycosyltransferase family protein [Leptolyngbyaceae cyanobacterium bins.349]|nr:tetratricopeptide repeat-containing glycosyltransferase family protein [Leptolyngbyaceae cyanobacterium bins.349]